MSKPEIISTVPALRDVIDGWRREGLRVALVPTMGALHEGHLELVRHGREVANRVVVSIFVNPKQFGPGEDFGAYPRVADRDRHLLGGLADCVYGPAGAEMYPEGFSTAVTVEGPSAGFEGAIRPGHFSGVATIVCKLFTQSGADAAIFGEKDWQQLQVVRRLVRDLDLRTEIVPHATVRDEHGLALSSRNAFLSAGELVVARRLNVVMRDVAEGLTTTAGSDWAATLRVGECALRDAGFAAVDYLTAVEAETLVPADDLSRPARLLVAARLGSVRLLDNIAVPPPPQRGPEADTTGH